MEGNLLPPSGTLKDASCVQIAEVPDDEAVRIFLEFERVESAIKGERTRPTPRRRRIQHPLGGRRGRPLLPSFISTFPNGLILSLDCVTALIMWANARPPSKWAGPDRKPGETRVPAGLHHTWPSYPVSPAFQSSESRTDAQGGIQSCSIDCLSHT